MTDIAYPIIYENDKPFFHNCLILKKLFGSWSI